MKPTSIGTLMINDALPEELRLTGKSLDKAEVMNLLRGLAEKHPEKYKDVLKVLNDVGRSAAYTEGVSVSLSALRKSPRERAIIDRVRQEVAALHADPTMDDKARDEAIVKTVGPMVDEIQGALKDEATKEGNPYWFQVKSGARGKLSEFNAMRGAQGLVDDHHNKPVPIPIMHSYAEGLDPVEYWAGTYGQRRGAIDVKFCLWEETEIKMADLSVKKLKDIRVGDQVLGSDLHGNLSPTRVVAVHDNGYLAVNRYRFRLNQTQVLVSVYATGDHRMLARLAAAHRYRTDPVLKKRALQDGRVFDNASKNDFVCALPSGGYDGFVAEHRALFYGVIAGDGSCGPTARTAEVSQVDPVFLAEFGAYMAVYGAELHQNGSRPGHRVVVPGEKRKFIRGAKGRIARPVPSAMARKWLEEVGMWGKLAHQKELPPQAQQWDNASMAAFIGGYISCDGCVSAQGANITVSVCSTSAALLEGVREHLLYRWGIQAGLGDVKVRAHMRRPQKILRISLRQSVERLAAVIPLIGKKRDQLAAALQKVTVKRVAPIGAKMVDVTSLGGRHVLDLEVDHPDHLFVLANGLISSNSTGDAGYFNKKLVNAAHRIMVTKERPDPTRLPVGLPTKVADRDNIGAVLAADAGGHKAGTLITPDVHADLEDAGVEDILIHSPLTEPTEDGGVSRLAAGRRSSAGLSPVGENLGIPAAQSIGERLSQGQLDSKHASGSKGTDRISRQGFAYLNRLVESPETFPEAGPLAEDGGTVTAVTAAPQGGNYVHVGDHQYYVHAGLKPIVAKGDSLEPGDDLSDGIPHPEQLVRLRGLGEARRVYADLFHEGMKNSGIQTHRRNTETVVAGLLNWAKITDPDGHGDAIVDEVVPYHDIGGKYQPRAGSELVAPSQAQGKYLEEHALHYTPGTLITKKVKKDLEKWKIKDVHVHDQAPAFQPYMQRGMLGVFNDPDWQTRLSGFYTTSAFTEAVHRGRESDPNSTSFVPSLVQGKGFGAGLKQHGTYGAPQVPSTTGPIR